MRRTTARITAVAIAIVLMLAAALATAGAASADNYWSAKPLRAETVTTAGTNWDGVTTDDLSWH